MILMNIFLGFGFFVHPVHYLLQYIRIPYYVSAYASIHITVHYIQTYYRTYIVTSKYTILQDCIKNVRFGIYRSGLNFFFKTLGSVQTFIFRSVTVLALLISDLIDTRDRVDILVQRRLSYLL